MIRSFVSELVRLQRRSVLLGWVGAVVGFTLLATMLTLRRIGEGGGGQGPEASFTLAQLSSPEGMAMILGVAATFLGVLTLGLFATLLANDYAQGTIRTYLVEQPRRLRLLAGKLLALSSFSALAIVMASVLGSALGLALAPGQGVDTSEWLTGEGIWALAGGIGNLILASLGWGMIGALLAVLIRAPAPAVAAGVAYALPVEMLLASAWEDAARWLPRGLLDAVAAGGTSVVSYDRALALAAVYVAVALVTVGVLFTRRDVTA